MRHNKTYGEMRDALRCNNRSKTGTAIVIALILSVFMTVTSGRANGGVVNISYTYDSLNRLKVVHYGGGKMIAYTYDSAGNTIKTTSTYTLADLMMCLQTITQLSPTGIASNSTSGADVNGDGKIGVPEAIYIMEKVAGMR